MASITLAAGEVQPDLMQQFPYHRLLLLSHLMPRATAAKIECGHKSIGGYLDFHIVSHILGLRCVDCWRGAEEG
jgi:hypothetical protein